MHAAVDPSRIPAFAALPSSYHALAVLLITKTTAVSGITSLKR